MTVSTITSRKKSTAIWQIIIVEVGLNAIAEFRFRLIDTFDVQLPTRIRRVGW